MTTVEVEFVYHTGVTRPVFRNPRLCGGWDGSGSPSPAWTTLPMTERLGDDGCPQFRATVEFPETAIGQEFAWGVLLDGPSGRDVWGVPTEVSDTGSTTRERRFVLRATGRSVQQHYWLSTSRRFGANKRLIQVPTGLAAGGDARLRAELLRAEMLRTGLPWSGVPRSGLPAAGWRTGARFAVWAPNARAVSLVFGDPVSGYIDAEGKGIVGDEITMRPDPLGGGAWVTDPDDPRLADFGTLEHRPYMFQVVRDDGTVAYRTDLFSRCQIGRGTTNPARLGPGEEFSGRREDLDGTVSCSVVIDPERVTERFSEPVWPQTAWVGEQEFWADEFDHERPVPSRVEDLVIYELHVGGLGAGRVDGAGEPVPGNLADAMGLLDHLVDLGVNAVELLPLAEFEGWASWGYGTSHPFATEFSGGGRDQLKHFVRECHRRGIAVIMDVVYNHYHHDAERAEWAYDSGDPARNIYYWYEGSPADHPRPDGGYVDNLSTGWAPRFWEEHVRQWLISSAVVLAVEFHIDGLRVDQTTSLHRHATLHADGTPVESANAFGAKFLRELTTTLRLVKPDIVLIAEDHSGWDAVTRPTELGGLGFDVAWYADFYHHLSGDTGRGVECANLLTTAAAGGAGPLAMGRFAEVLERTPRERLVYHESHDEAGNSAFDGGRSGRTIAIAVGRAPLVGETRRYAEARARFACGMSMLSAGTPMFFMGEEVGACEDYRHDDFAWHRTDLAGAARGDGAALFAFYRAIITLRRSLPVLRSRSLRVVHVHDGNRVLAFGRTYGDDDVLVVASLNDRPFTGGYRIGGVPDGGWLEIFNSDTERFGGWNDGNSGGVLPARDGMIEPVVPRAGFIVLRHL